MASPSFNAERGEIWYSDGFQGFFSVRLTNDVWPFPSCQGEQTTLPVGAPLGDDADVIAGGVAGERIATRGGADRVCAKAGRDRIEGGAGRDRL